MEMVRQSWQEQARRTGDNVIGAPSTPARMPWAFKKLARRKPDALATMGMVEWCAQHACEDPLGIPKAGQERARRTGDKIGTVRPARLPGIPGGAKRVAGASHTHWGQWRRLGSRSWQLRYQSRTCGSSSRKFLKLKSGLGQSLVWYHFIFRGSANW